MKKILISIVCVVLLGMIALPAMAAGTMTPTPSSTSVYRDSTFTVAVSVSGVGEYRRGGIQVSYDTSKFELVKGEWNLSDVFFSEFDEADNTGSYVLNSSTKLSGKVFVFTFKVKSKAEFKTGDITVELTLGQSEEVITKTVKVTVACNHKYSAWTASGDKHTRKCSVCGQTESKAHTYTYLCDKDCNDCGATRETDHSYAEEWLGDETGHWHLCTHCGEKSPLEEHIPGEEAGEYTDQVCTVCNTVIAPALGHQHSYDDTYLTNFAAHWAKCLGCGEESEPVLHTFENECDTTCDVCNYLRAVNHNLGETWVCDTDGHWKLCQDCGLHVEQETHMWEDVRVTSEPTMTREGKLLKVCAVCRTETTEIIPAVSMTDGVWWLWLIIGAAGGIVITVVIGFVVFGVGMGKKSGKGKYSG